MGSRVNGMVSFLTTVVIVVVVMLGPSALATREIADYCGHVVGLAGPFINDNFNVCVQKRDQDSSLVRYVCVQESQQLGLFWIFAETNSRDDVTEISKASIDSNEKYRVYWSIEDETSINNSRHERFLKQERGVDIDISIRVPSAKELSGVQKHACSEFLEMGTLDFDERFGRVFDNQITSSYRQRGRFLSTNTTAEERSRMREGFATILGMMTVLVLMALPLFWMVLLTANWVS